MDSPPFQAIPASVAKLVADGGKLQGLHSRLLDGNSNGAAMSTGFGSSPNFKGYDRDNGATPTLREADSNGSKIISAGASLLGDFPEQKPTAVSNAAKEPVVNKRESPPIAEEVPKVADEKLSGTKRPLPAEDEERSVITIEEESSRERKFRDKKSPKAVKSGGLTQYVDDAEGQQGSNQGGKFGRATSTRRRLTDHVNTWNRQLSRRCHRYSTRSDYVVSLPEAATQWNHVGQR
jgi:hypothetical protein